MKVISLLWPAFTLVVIKQHLLSPPFFLSRFDSNYLVREKKNLQVSQTENFVTKQSQYFLIKQSQ